MAQCKMSDGNAAAVQTVSMVGVKVVSTYPITPQSPVAKKLSNSIAQRILDTNYIRIESEHSILSCALGAQLVGVRAATTTASVGLALVREICDVVSGVRAPLIMPVTNRVLAPPWSLQCDHQDSIAERDSGWLQFYCEDVREIYDLLLMAYRIAKHERILLPAVVCFDDFFLSYSTQKVSAPEQDKVTDSVEPYREKNYWPDPVSPVSINDFISMEEFTKIKHRMMRGSETAESVLQKTAKEFESRFGRKIQMLEGYRTEDVETILIRMDSMTGTMKYFVNEQREKGEKVGVAKMTSLRPLPIERMRALVQNAKKIAVFDRSAGLGAAGEPLFLETVSAVGGDRIVKGYIGGLDDGNVNPVMIKRMHQDIQQAETASGVPVWTDTKENPMEIRGVLRYV